MKSLARLGDPIIGGAHCHGHDHGPQPSPGKIIQGSDKVFIEGLPAARDGDQGYSPVCCGGIGKIVIQAQPGKVFIDGKPAAAVGTRTMHCGMAPGNIQAGSSKVMIK